MINGPSPTGAPPLELIPLGGLGEFGMNMMVVACGGTAIVIDAGVMFPEPDLLGVDLIIPDLRQLQQYRVQALVLTHGHEDHIGAVAHVLPYVDGPVYGTPLTLALIEPKLAERGEDAKTRLRAVAPRDRVEVGAFTVEFLRVTHSMP
ncbi:MAG: ribonuclease J, partial [Acidobacteria bacterium]